MSLRVVHTFGHSAGATAIVDRPVVRFGRSPDNDVAFDPHHDLDASGHHAEARLEAEGWVLVDLGSRNGTFVGGQRVTRRLLTSGDEVTFGAKGPRVRLELLDAPARPPAPQPAPPPHVAPYAPPPPAPHVAPYAPPPPAPHVAPYAPPPPAPHVAPYAPPPPAPHVAPYAPPPPAPHVAPYAPPPPAPHVAPYAPPPPAPHVAPYAPPPPHHAAPAQAQPPVAPPAGARVGQRTIAMMIASAVSGATGRSRPRGTIEISAMVDEHVRTATAGHRRTTYALALVLVVALASLVAIILYNRSSQDEITRLREDLTRLPPEDPRRKEIEGRLGTLHPPNANFGRNLYDRSRKGIFMLASGASGFCSAFAVRPSVLATNAHCIVTAKRHGGSVVALENEGRGQVRFAVTDLRAHPRYRDGDPDHLTPDVGIVTISGRAAAVLELASAQDLAASGAGDGIYIIGFPGRLMDTTNPAATFLAAHIGRITDSAGRPAQASEAWLIQHDAPTEDGTSGSPIFNGAGKVIGINAGGYREGDDETIAGRKTEVVRASPYKFGMRVDLLDAVLR